MKNLDISLKILYNERNNNAEHPIFSEKVGTLKIGVHKAAILFLSQRVVGTNEIQLMRSQ
jgi:hypothetical protein